MYTFVLYIVSNCVTCKQCEVKPCNIQCLHLCGILFQFSSHAINVKKFPVVLSVYILCCISYCYTLSDNVNRRQRDRKNATVSYPVMKVVTTASRSDRVWSMERMMTVRLPNMYKTINGQITDITVRVMDKYREKTKVQRM